ncbi:Uncharacterized protein PECH_001020 [Penicillium ucsense]|uniref:Sodium/calcium exchanger membrane region domain-containing protein n=1 Tax=Penicillium ucsense TaxID=2839758 RepID=A0A8J8WMC4_9EURO|nr:Uncharacterized protein PECM_002421 [Penicillium ucsense]KAF7738261.1 Uncharacterized protein PECH_001020 [Penicillium ucsense]
MNRLPSILRARRSSPRYSVRPFYVSILVIATLAVASWGLQRRTPDLRAEPFVANALFRRTEEEECRLVRNAKDQCAYIRQNCPDHQDGYLSYLQLYYCALPHAKPVAFIIIVLWLSFLFSTIGIAASDFLCINLSTLASILGMSESLTGVTFLAFGNGSPDVFSTFAAMRSNSGSLAIGELIGAATFITSVVAGSMALVRPFKVARRSFVRDVGFFVIAVGFSMVLVADGRLQAWESAAMVALYVFYVMLVVSWHWYIVRRRRKYERDMAARSFFHIPENQELEIDHSMEEDDDPGVASESRSLLRGASSDNFDLLERQDGFPIWKADEDDFEDDDERNRYLAEIGGKMHVNRRPTGSRRNTSNVIRPSLVGALEFQSVLQSLRKSRTSRRNPTTSLSSYSDNEDDSVQAFDTRSIASHPRASRPTTIDGLLSPHGADTSRARAVSANDADGLEIDRTVFERQGQGPRLTVRRPSSDCTEDISEGQHQKSPQIKLNTFLTVSPPQSKSPSRSSSPTTSRNKSLSPELPATRGQFSSPDYQTQITRDRSPLAVSPRGGSGGDRFEDGLASPVVPFPEFVDLPSSSPGVPTLRLPNPATSPSERLLMPDGLNGIVADTPASGTLWVQGWKTSALSRLALIAGTLFPTLADWRKKNVTERLLGIVAAPSVFLLTITVPVAEPSTPESNEFDPPSVVVVDGAARGGNPAPIVQLPADSPTLHATEPDSSVHHHSNSASRRVEPGHRLSQHEPIGRPRWDSELPAVSRPAPEAAATEAKEWNRWLVAIQLFTGPFILTYLAWSSLTTESDAKDVLRTALISLLFSILCLGMFILSTRRRPSYHSPQRGRQDSEVQKPQSLPAIWQPLLSMLGFLVAICWIATIATEVVSILKTIGVILDISDSLLGLTVFAVGNSLGDLVADITIARLGYPVMALSACFGGPMLNILLGVGLGGLYMTLGPSNPSPHSVGTMTRPATYEIAISKVLVISGATLLFILAGLLIVVPLNHWRMDRRIGWGLIAVWCVSTLGNVIAELVW